MSAAPPPFQAFVDEQSEHVWRFLVASVGRAEAEDCFQETFIAALRAYPRLRANQREHNLRAWVLTIAQRKALDSHRARARRAVPVADPAEHEPAAGAGGLVGLPGGGQPSADRDDALWGDALWGAVAQLPERQRSAVVLRFVGDLPHREIAAAMGCSEEAARRSLHEGLSKLREAVPS